MSLNESLGTAFLCQALEVMKHCMSVVRKSYEYYFLNYNKNPQVVNYRVEYQKQFLAYSFLSRPLQFSCSCFCATSIAKKVAIF